jgi:hypothetical protein
MDVQNARGPGRFWEAVDDQSGFTARIEDDGSVAYAYLVDEDDNIVSDVWLYNCGSPPETPEWQLPDARSLMPFRNSKAYVKDIAFQPISDEDVVSCRFIRDGDRLQSVEIFLRGELHARLAPGRKPGECVLAAIANPIALPLSDSVN